MSLLLRQFITLIVLESLVLGQSQPTLLLNGISNITEDTAMVRARVTEAGITSTITCTLSAASPGATGTCGVATGDGSKFPTGSVVSVGHVHWKVTNQVGDTLSIIRGYDPDVVISIFTEFSSVVTVSSGVAHMVMLNPAYYVAGDSIRVFRSPLIPEAPTYTVAASPAPTPTDFYFTCGGCTDGTDGNAGLTFQKTDPAHSPGETIRRVDMHMVICFGATTSYGNQIDNIRFGSTNFVMGTSLYAYFTSMVPGATIHYKIQVTPRSSTLPTTCASPGADTVESPDQTLTFLNETSLSRTPRPPAPVQFGFMNITFTDTRTIASDCSDMATKYAELAALDGNLNYKLIFPDAAVCAPLTTGGRTGVNPDGHGIIYLERQTAMPAGRVTSPTGLPGIKTATSSQAIFVGPNSRDFVFHGLHVYADYTKSSVNTMTADFSLITSFDGSRHDYIAAERPKRIAFWQCYVDAPIWINTAGGARLDGKDLIFLDSTFGPLFRQNDHGAIQIDGYYTDRVLIQNNLLMGGFSSFIASDNGKNPLSMSFLKNYMYKPEEWNNKNILYQKSAAQSISSVTAGNPTIISTGSSENNVTTGKPMSFAGMPGSYATPLNTRTWSVTAGDMDVDCDGVTFVCHITTASPHGLTNGQLVTIGGGFMSPCHNFYTGEGNALAITFVDSTHYDITVAFTSTFSTINGPACQKSDLKIMGPMYLATKINATSYSITLDSTGFGNLSNTGTMYYRQFIDVKNCWEIKTAVRLLFYGNVIENCPAIGQPGNLMVNSTRGSDSFLGWVIATTGGSWVGEQAISDIDIRYNVELYSCNGIGILGMNDTGPSNSLRRLRAEHNLLVGINANRFSGGTGGCTQNAFPLNGSYSYVILNHNTIAGSPNRPVAEDSGTYKSGVVTMTNNIIDKTADMGNGSCTGFGLIMGLCPGNPTLYSWRTATLGRNAWYSDSPVFQAGFSPQFYNGSTSGSMPLYQNEYWPRSFADLGFAGVINVTAATNPATGPIVITTSTPHGCSTGDYIYLLDAAGNTAANGHWAVGVIGPNTLRLSASKGNGTFTGTAHMLPIIGCGNSDWTKYALAAGSPYRAGVSFVAPAADSSTAGQGPATDGTDVGADINAIIQATGNGGVNRPTGAALPTGSGRLN